MRVCEYVRVCESSRPPCSKYDADLIFSSAIYERLTHYKRTGYFYDACITILSHDCKYLYSCEILVSAFDNWVSFDVSLLY